ncbi:MAG: hypothetical protein M3362_04715 [Acidobacteriota bacterium]|nr:hypothetical protein [Acidobacteriota bacterium]
MNKLLILSCSRTKRAEAELLPAFKRYDGPPYRLLRRYLNASTKIPKIKILSAEYGLISHDFQIPYYERRMTTQRAQELKPQVTKEINSLLRANSSTKEQGIFIYLGKEYLGALEGSNIFSSKGVVKIAAGTPGKRLADLYGWLYGESLPPERHLTPLKSKSGIHLRGINIKLNREEVLKVARRALNNATGYSASYHSWYVLIDDSRVSPKWLVSLLTSLPVNAFHSDEARRVLSQLDMEVIRA